VSAHEGVPHDLAGERPVGASPLREAYDVVAGYLGLALVCTLLTGCPKKAAIPDSLTLLEPEVVQVAPDAPSVPPLGEAGASALGEHLARQIEAAGLARRRARDDAGTHAATGRALRLRIAVGCERVEAEGRALERVGLEIKLDERPGTDPASLHAQLLATGVRALSPTKPPASADCQELATRTADDRLGRFLAEWQLKSAAPAAIARALEVDGGTGRLEAIRLVGERRLVDLGPRLFPLLHDEDEEVRDAALGAILQLKERKAVPVLTRGRDLQDRRELRKVVDALGVLGGQEAEEFLSFVADTHDDPEIKRMAKQALARLGRDAGGT